MRSGLIRDDPDSPYETNEIPMNRGLCYRSGKEQEHAARKYRLSVSERIEKSAIKGYLIWFPDCNIYATVVRAKTSVYQTVSSNMRLSGGRGTTSTCLNPKD
jgi:hypothetical protein